MAEIKYVDWDGLVYYDGKSKQYIESKFDLALKYAGEYTFDTVPAPGFDSINFTYKITDTFTVSPGSLLFVDSCKNRTFAAGTVIIVENIDDRYMFNVLFEAVDPTIVTPGGEIHLENYYTKLEVDELLNGKVTFSELQNYYTKNELDPVLASKLNNSDLEGYATETFVREQLSAIEFPDVPKNVSELTNDAGYVTLDELPNTDDFATTDYVDNAVKNITVDTSALATKEELEAVQTTAGSNSVKLFAVESELFDINKKLNELSEPDLSGYATEEFVATAINAIKIPDEYVTEEELLAKDFATKDDLAAYAKDEDLSTISLCVEEIGKTVSKNTADIETLDESVSDNTGSIEALRGEVTEVSDKVTDLQEAVNNIVIPEVPTKVSELENDAGYLTDHQDLSEYAKKSELPSVEGLASEEFVIKKIAEAELADQDVDLSSYYTKSEVDALIPEVPSNVSAFTNDANYTTLAEVATQGYLTSIPEEYVTAEELAQEGFLKEHQSLEGYVKDAELNDAIDAVEHKIVTKTSELENDAGFVKEGSLPAFVKPDDITDFVTLAEVEEAGFIKSIPDEYITESELNERQYITDAVLMEKGFITDVSDKADKDHSHSYKELTDTPVIPSIEGLATEKYVDDAVANIDIPTVNTDNFVTKNTVDTLLATKANDVPFADDYRVGTALGGFIAEESLQGMTVVQILTKLLGLTLYIPPAGNVPEGTTPTVENIITNEVPIYHLSNAGEPAGSNFEYKTMTVTEGAQDNQNAAFMYQIIDENGVAIESGYQIVTEELDEGYLTVYIPETVTNFSIRIFDGIGGSWVTPEWGMIENSNYHLDGYKVYTADPSYDIYERMTIRVVIEN